MSQANAKTITPPRPLKFQSREIISGPQFSKLHFTLCESNENLYQIVTTANTFVRLKMKRNERKRWKRQTVFHLTMWPADCRSILSDRSRQTPYWKMQIYGNEVPWLYGRQRVLFMRLSLICMLQQKGIGEKCVFMACFSYRGVSQGSNFGPFLIVSYNSQTLFDNGDFYQHYKQLSFKKHQIEHLWACVSR